MKRKITVFIVAVAPSAIALIAAGFVSFASGSPSSSGPYGSAATASPIRRSTATEAELETDAQLGRVAGHLGAVSILVVGATILHAIEAGFNPETSRIWSIARVRLGAGLKPSQIGSVRACFDDDLRARLPC